MKKKITTKKKIILLAVIVLLAAAIAITAVISLNVYSQEQMKKIPPMTAMETLSYTLKDTENAVVTIGTIQNGEKSWKVYGNNCSELPAELHTYEICSLTKTVTAAKPAKDAAMTLSILSVPILFLLRPRRTFSLRTVKQPGTFVACP